MILFYITLISRKKEAFFHFFRRNCNISFILVIQKDPKYENTIELPKDHYFHNISVHCSNSIQCFIHACILDGAFDPYS